MNESSPSRTQTHRASPRRIIKVGTLVLLGAMAYRHFRASRPTADVRPAGATVPLDSRMKALNTLLNKASGLSVAELTAEEMIQRSGTAQSGPLFRLMTGWPRRGVRQEDRTIPGQAGAIPIRIYTPERPARAPRPLVLAFHGGGWAQGTLDMADWMSSTVAADLDAVVVSVDYRLAPAHPFPAAVEDSFDALKWCAANKGALGAEGRIGVLGESAGGNLAAVICLLAKQQGGPVVHHQALIYPATDLAQVSASRRAYAQGDQVILTTADIDAFERFYLPEGTLKSDWRVSPLRAPSHRDLPPALILVAGHDPLRDDGLQYAEVLRAAGVPVTLGEYPAMPHAFISFPYFSRDAGPAMKQVVAAQKQHLQADL
ncbi:alpha/beta hydrolase fold domain-containing protein [Deinococcus sonorensis]|uniref:Alpha/beta hydrolase fold domain-containing protein n=1 Tax=Deinococcus sonorensis TaxID=309891 RepID=A0ABV8YA84_9DEIO